MAVTYTASVFGDAEFNDALKTRAQNVTVSTAGPTSLEVITIVHGCRSTPHYVQATVRSTILTPSGGGAFIEVGAYNASIATLYLLAADGGATQANIDVICGIYHRSEEHTSELQSPPDL